MLMKKEKLKRVREARKRKGMEINFNGKGKKGRNQGKKENLTKKGVGWSNKDKYLPKVILMLSLLCSWLCFLFACV